jgi:heme/copper-type cytochrome/quinol oxidase subunit 3
MSNTSESFRESAEEIEYEARAEISAIWTGGRLLIGMYTFLVASLVFSYFYLRSSNNGGLWRPDHVTAPVPYGWAIAICMVLTSFLAIYGQTRFRKGGTNDWQVAGWTGVATGLLALFLQCWELSRLGFFPGQSGYSSTFIGFVVINIMTIVISTYWLETTLARALRLRRVQGGERPELSTTDDARELRADIAAMTYWQGFVILVVALTFSMFYLM